MNLVEIHIIQNVAPSNLNRDDTGSPKDAFFGGVRRARLSSQSQKRAVRDYFKATLSHGTLQPDDLALRTKRLVDELTDRLEVQGHSRDEARRVAKAALGGMGLAVDDRELTQYLLFMGRREISRLADIIHGHWQVLTEVAASSEAGDGQAKAKKKAAKAAVPSDLHKALETILDGGKAVDLALFGRMLADEPKWSIDAAAQVAHALSTHQVDREFDFYTAVDDLNPKEETGAGMMGDVEFYSACLYRYANVDLGQLVQSLQGDRELAAKGVEAFLRGFTLTLPSGKQNSFAAHNLPGFVALVTSEAAAPRNLAGAFEKPVRARDRRSLSGLSVEALLSTWETLDRAYGRARRQWVALLNLTDATVSYHGEHVKPSFDEALTAAMDGVRTLLEVK
ncbi:type I-E CRISPR-associated protein Cas7/Cse4/CasC [Carboxydochorda subterranea]|uniref:Type I-E CRISPR-associated protein Cas7/Cse4/CasC n=1 Tax=Carboxydichorda subterranea TaxID=3109565 RepID=A0ABZ1BU91_9FIRM|nr:type I-E CRISPR-associated protein Cas7/Cse4/CasC [Limnochorda sp. L945t]WRP16339.1 type I-E CRISPR-associated protein Cas7/Cse4/CasC [Limnochorda sp. L945t]